MIFKKFERLLLAVLSFLICISYGLGLPGDFAFDDGVNLLYNANFVFLNFDFDNIYRATFSSESGPFGRPVAMFTFALNQFFSGGIYPLGLKITNIFIHLFNSILLFFLLKIFSSLHGVFDSLSQKQRDFLPIVLAFIWGLHPFVLTSVLYVVQRMTSLSATFMFISLIFYLLLRKNEFNGGAFQGKRLAWLFLIILSFLLAVLAKETALLLGFFFFVFEVYYLGFKREKGVSRLATSMVAITVVMPAMVVLIKVALDPSWITSGYSGRSFSLIERVLTQPRILLFYLTQIYFPNISEMGIFHDDIPLSRDWTTPRTTLFALIACIGLFFCAVVSSAAKNPILKAFGFSFAWFFVGHLFESTVFPLEIAHEHRNYLPMIGPLYFGVYLLLFSDSSRFSRLQFVVIVSFIVVLTFLTSLRTLSWQNLTDHALTEALNHPKSSRSQYQLGRVYLKWFQETSDRSYLHHAHEAFTKAIEYDWEGRNAAYFGIINLAYAANSDPGRVIIDELKERLKSSKSVGADMVFFNNLAQCQIAMECKLADEDFLMLSEAILDNKNVGAGVRSSIFATVGAYYINKMDDRFSAERFFLSAVDSSRSVLRLLDLAEYYRITARFQLAHEALAEAEKISLVSDRLNIDRFRIRLTTSENEMRGVSHH